MIKRNRNQGAGTVIRCVRLPAELDERIGDLANKSLITKSAWIVKTLKREAAPKSSISNEKNSENDKNE